MRSYGLSAGLVLALASGVWASPPLAFGPGGPPAPAGVAYTAEPPVAYPGAQSVMFAPGAQPPTFLPPIPAPPPGGAGAPGAPERAADPNGFGMDPAFPYAATALPRVPGEWWVRGDWLYWDLRDAPLPVLVTSGDPGRVNAGIPGLGNMSVLNAASRSPGQLNGARVTIGRWFDPAGELGGEVSGFLLERGSTTDTFVGSAALPVVSVPVIGADGTVGVYDFAFPGRFDGGVTLRTATTFGSAEAHLLRRLYVDQGLSFDGLFGYRYMRLDERLDMTASTRTLDPTARFAGAPVPAGARIVTTDSFRVRNEFHGLQIGGRFEARFGMATVTAFGKGGAGATLQTLYTDGNTAVSGFGVNRTAFGGVRALPGNFGRRTNTDFSLVGETGIEVGLQVTKNVAFRVGYNLLWWSDVLRPGTAVSPVLSRQQVPIDPAFGAPLGGPARPVAVFRSTDFLAHGLTVGVVIDW